jgi:hypothetical protein
MAACAALGEGKGFLASLIASVGFIVAVAAPKPAPWLVVRGEFFGFYTNWNEAAAIDVIKPAGPTIPKIPIKIPKP